VIGWWGSRGRPARPRPRRSRDPAGGLRRDRDGALVVHALADRGALRIAEARRGGWQGGAAGHAALPRPARAQFVEPALEVLELVDVLALRLPVDRPRVADHVGDRVLVAGHILAAIELVVEDAVEPVGLVGKAVDRVGQIAGVRAGAAEMAA